MLAAEGTVKTALQLHISTAKTGPVCYVGKRWRLGMYRLDDPIIFPPIFRMRLQIRGGRREKRGHGIHIMAGNVADNELTTRKRPVQVENGLLIAGNKATDTKTMLIAALIGGALAWFVYDYVMKRRRQREEEKEQDSDR